MNARGVNALAGVINAAMKTRSTAAGIAMAVDAAGLLMSPELAAALAELREASAAGEMPEDQLAAVRAREAATTPGPWGTYDDGTGRLDVVAGLEETGTGYTGRREIAQTVESPMDNDPAHIGWDDEDDEEQCRADGRFIAAARSDVPALLTEVGRLRAELADAISLRNHWMTDAYTSHERIKALEADHNADVPRLRQSVKEWAERCRTAEAEREDLRVQLAEAQALADTAPRTTWFLADYEGAEDGPALFATVDAAKAWVDGWAVGDPYWDWAEHDGAWVQCLCDPDTDRPVGRGSGTVTPHVVPASGAEARVSELELERHSTNETLSDAAESIRAKDARIAELEQQLTTAVESPLAWTEQLDAKSLDNFLISLGQATDYEPMNGAISYIHELLTSFRVAVAARGGEPR